jgi:ketosteroid isomerase-like protein
MSFRATSRFAVVLCMCLSIGLAAQEQGAVAQVRRLEEKWAEAYKKHDIETLSKLLTDDFVTTVEDGSVYSKSGYIAFSADTSVRVEAAQASDLRIRIRGNNAVVTAFTMSAASPRASPTNTATASPTSGCGSETAGKSFAPTTVCP